MFQQRIDENDEDSRGGCSPLDYASKKGVGQQECLKEPQNDAEWVVCSKAKPKDKATQTFREYGKCIFEGKRAKVKQDNDNQQGSSGQVKQDNDNQQGSSGGKHVTRARSWWKRGDVDACAAQTNMQCWVSQEMIFDGEQAETHLREAWEHESGKDEMNVVLQGLE